MIKRFSTRYGRFVAYRPWQARAVVIVMTVVAIFGLSLTVDQAADSNAFLPSNSELVEANNDFTASSPASSSLEAKDPCAHASIRE